MIATTRIPLASAYFCEMNRPAAGEPYASIAYLPMPETDSDSYKEDLIRAEIARETGYYPLRMPKEAL